MDSNPIDEELEQSFPASDPPDWTGTHAGAPRQEARDGGEALEAGEPGKGRRGPDLLVAAGALRDRAMAAGPLDSKTVELIAFASQITHLQESAGRHAEAARRNGASLEELRHALAIAAVNGGFGALDAGLKILNDLR
jgi:AhpD family alkylhydroperoxidase